MYGIAVALGIVVGLSVDGSLFAAEEVNPYGAHVNLAPPRNAQEQLAAFHLPPGFTIQLVAAEPEIRKPINLAFDDAGRLYATSSVEYPYPAVDAAKARDVVVRFDIGPDGRATRAQPVVKGLNIPIGVCAVGEELLVYSIPEVLRCRDADGDGIFETKRPILRGFGFRDTHGMVNGLTPWIDGWVYACHGFSNESNVVGSDGSKIRMESGNTFRFRPDGSQVEHFSHGQVNPFGLAFDEWGHLFSADCHSQPAYHLLRGAYYPSFGKPHDGLGFGPPIMKHAHGSTGIAGIVYYEADQLPEAYRRTLFIGNPITGRINHDKLDRSGATYRAIEQPDFLSCDDPWFRPVDIKLGPDGALYIADFYNCIIGHYEVPLDHPKRDRERGRIWRVVYTGEGAEPAKTPNVSAAGFDELVKLLGHANLTVRTMATNRLATEKRSRDQVKSLVAVLENRREIARRRAHVAWVLQRIDHTLFEEEADIVNVVLDDDPLVQAHSLAAWTERSNTNDVALSEKTHELLSDAPERFVRLAAADAAARLDDGSVSSLLEAWRATPSDDKQLTHALRIAVKAQLGTGRRLAEFLRSTSVVEAQMDDRRRLAEICLAIPDQAAADFILDVLSDREPKIAYPKPYIEHAARHLADKRLPELEDYCTKFRTAPIERRLDVYRALINGLATRSKELPPPIAADLDAIVFAKLRGMDESTVKHGIELTKEFRRAEYFSALVPLVDRDQRWPQLRPLAIEACAACDARAATPLLTNVMNNPLESPDIVKKAVQQLASLKDGGARAALLTKLSDASQQLAFDIAAAIVISPEGAEALLQAVAAGKASPRLLQEGPVVFWLARSNPTNWNERVKSLTAHLPPPDDRLGKLVIEKAASVRKAKPDLARGEAIFKKNCAVCHKIGGQGKKLGPELDGIGRRGVERLLEDMLDPSRTVDQAFRATQFTLADGRLLTGLVLREEGEVVVVADAQGKEVRLRTREIEERQTLPLSPMPANVAEIVREDELPHLVGFLLASDKAAPQAAPTR